MTSNPQSSRRRLAETMSKQTRVSQPIYSLLPTKVEGFESLAELALHVRWSWNHATHADHQVFEIETFLNDLDPNEVRVELYVDGTNGGDPIRLEMKCVGSLPDASRRCIYYAAVLNRRPTRGYTVRVTPQRSGVAVPLECARILWQR